MADHRARENRHGVGFTCVDRDASESNPADGPSRLQFRRLDNVAQGRIQIVEPPDLFRELRAGRQEV